MLIITTHNFSFFSRKEIWFYNGENINSGAYNMYSAANQIRDSRVQFLEKYQTTIVDLSKSEDELFSALHPRLRDYIRSAEKKKLDFHPLLRPTKMDCKNLMISFREMAKLKGITFLSKRWVSAVQKSGSIYITRMLFNDVEIVTHVYIFDKQKVSLTNSYHNNNLHDKSLRSDANKLLHWKDILLFKKMNFLLYDFGGINLEKLPGISQFKLSYGGSVEENYRYIQTSKLIYQLIRLIKIMKGYMN